ncbi:GNAT family N-acetyltransferase [Thermoanaerobacterium sp. DL9XJH110]|uniref:GNAT family N-acetyltransferase n=1 Tax=Thermoanaerobacterium sp. DL9XJH110 TaxID=3386643 RepID=UPI003BB70782
MSLKIRNAKPGDEVYIVELIKELSETIGEASGISVEFAKNSLSFPCFQILVAEEHGRVVGLISYSVKPSLYHGANSCIIEDLVVKQQARGRGVGSALIREALIRIQKLGCAEVSVSTMPDNEKAIRFYRACGFTDEALFLEKHFFKSK